MPPPARKRSRASEIALLENLSTSLDTYIDDNPISKGYRGASSKSDKSKSAAKNFLAVKTLVKSIAKACVSENIVVSWQTTEGDKTDAMIDRLVKEFKEKYPALNKKLLVDGIVRYNAQNNIQPPGEEVDERKYANIVSDVGFDMEKYY